MSQLAISCTVHDTVTGNKFDEVPLCEIIDNANDEEVIKKTILDLLPKPNERYQLFLSMIEC
jgi:hypothetical protein